MNKLRRDHWCIRQGSPGQRPVSGRGWAGPSPAHPTTLHAPCHDAAPSTCRMHQSCVLSKSSGDPNEI